MANSIEIPRIMTERKVQISRLTNDHVFRRFDCGCQDLNDFLFDDAKVHLRHLRYTTTLLETDDRTIAYYSLANDLLSISDREDFKEEIDSLDAGSIEFAYEERFFNQIRYPAVKLGRLAVDVDFQSQGVGAFILNSLVKSFTVNNKTGCQFITVDAINDHQMQRAIRFYERHGFKLLTAIDLLNDSRAMFKPLLDCRKCRSH
jgi:GNAT superfamily N-acetyltransferase